MQINEDDIGVLLRQVVACRREHGGQSLPPDRILRAQLNP
jgi:hypothetical protein